MARRIGEPIDVSPAGAGERASPPRRFRWRGAHFDVVTVLGHWREDAAYWSGGGVDIPQRDLWRVEARNGGPSAGVFELVLEHGRWRLDRVWD
jgi:hypothetical protein